MQRARKTAVYATFVGEQNSAFLKVLKLNSIDDAFFGKVKKKISVDIDLFF